ncbi:MAG TPA: LPS export ABC transporter permease LptF [Verrucomicrobiae bacterium]|nr:LPS export ABC transporter permease LptF [Verrucomicrobiae bacterium]
MKKTLFRYVFNEISQPFLLGLLVFTATLLMGKLLKLAELVMASGVPLLDVGRMILYLLPTFWAVAVPMASLLAVLLAIGRLSSDGETTAVKACGLSLYSFFPPALLFALLTGCLTAVITLWGLPWGHTQYRAFVKEMVESRTSLSPREGVFNDQFPGIVLYVDRYDEATALMQGVLIHDERDPAQPMTIFADHGTLRRDSEKKTIRLLLADGSAHSEGKQGEYRILGFGEYDLTISLERAGEKRGLELQSMTPGELVAGAAAATGEQRNQLVVEYQRRFALPVACMVFAVCGLPLGLQNRRSGKSGGFSSAVVILLAYYMVFTAASNAGGEGVVSPVLAPWIPNVLFLALGVYLTRKAAAEQEIPGLDLVMSLPRRGLDLLRRRKK